MFLAQASRIFFRYFNYLFAVIIAGMYANALLFPNMGVDAGFYLRVTECIAEGAVPEYDLRIVYPPMIFYMLLPLKLMIGKAIAYELFLGYMFFVQAVNAFLLYKITGKYTRDGFIRAFSGLLYLFLSMKYEGEYFFLEPFVNFWGLLAIRVYLVGEGKNKFLLLLSGVFAFLAFLTKQYGLAYAAAIYLLIFTDHRKSLYVWFRKSIVFTSGLVLGLVFFVLLFKMAYGVYYDFLAGGRLGLYGKKDLQGMLNGLIEYMKIAPWILLLFIPPFFKRVFKASLHVMAYILLVILFSVQLYFQQYEHYYILMLPALMVIFAMLAMQIIRYQQSRIILIVVLLLSLCVNEFFISPRTKSLLFSTKTTLSEEIRQAEKINEVVPGGSKVYLFANVKFYYLCHFNPALPDKYGFAYNNALYAGEMREIISASEFIMLYSEMIHSQYPLIDSAVVLRDLPDYKNYKLIENVGSISIFQNLANTDN